MSEPHKKPVTTAIRLALTASAAMGLSSALAQDQEEDKVVLDRVEVTGSRISRVEIEGASPVTVIDRDAIKRLGTADLGELLQDLPMMSGSPTSSQRNDQGDGRVAVDIRGLGTNRTLVLINGNRLPTLFNDFSVIPVVMVERVDILKSGATAIYGADAVAGVVNIITRRDFEGAEFEFQIGESFDEGGSNKSISFITGGNSDRGNFVVGVEYVEQEEVFRGAYDEEYLNKSVTVYDPDEFREYGFSGDPWTDQDNNGIAGWASFGSSRIPYGRFDLSNWNPAARSWTICRDSAGGGSLTTDYGPRGAVRGCGPATYDFAPFSYMQTPYQRSSFFLQADYELFEGTNVYLESHFANRRSEQKRSPLPYDSRFDPSYADVQPGAAISADNYYNPFGVDVRQWRRRMVEAGGRSFNQDVNQWQIIAGVQGQFAETWNWDISYNYGRNDRTDTDFGQFNGIKLIDALGPSFLDPVSGEVICGTPENPIPDCVSLNAFTNPDTNPITDVMLAGLSLALNDRYVTERQVFNATLMGDLFDLPAGPVAGAFGFERRREAYAYIPDSAKATGQTTGSTGPGTAGKYVVDSLFAELNIPLLSGARGAELLELSLGGRYDDFSLFEAETTFQLGLRWRPVRSLLLRATAGDVLREPNVAELFAGQFDSLQNVSDPCSGKGGTAGGVPGSGECEDVPPAYVQSDPEVRARIGGNSSVTPEEGDTVTVGLAWSPESVPGISMTLDWWRVEIDDAIGQPGANMALAGCFSGAEPGFCDDISRIGPESGSWGELEHVFTLVQKVGPESAEGLDWSLAYTLNSGIGLWGFSWFGTYNISREALVLKDPNGDGQADAFFGNLVGLYEHRSLSRISAYPKWRWRFDLDWGLGDWALSLGVNFIDEITDCGSWAADPVYLTMFCPDDAEIVSIDPADTYHGIPLAERAWINTVDSTWYIDLVGRYTLSGWGTQLSLGITNLTDEALPFFNQGPVANTSTLRTDSDTYRAFGRAWFFSIRHSF